MRSPTRSRPNLTSFQESPIAIAQEFSVSPIADSCTPAAVAIIFYSSCDRFDADACFHCTFPCAPSLLFLYILRINSCPTVDSAPINQTRQVSLNGFLNVSSCKIVSKHRNETRKRERLYGTLQIQNTNSWTHARLRASGGTIALEAYVGSRQVKVERPHV